MNFLIIKIYIYAPSNMSNTAIKKDCAQAPKPSPALKILQKWFCFCPQQRFWKSLKRMVFQMFPDLFLRSRPSWKWALAVELSLVVSRAMTWSDFVLVYFLVHSCKNSHLKGQPTPPPERFRRRSFTKRAVTEENMFRSEKHIKKNGLRMELFQNSQAE